MAVNFGGAIYAWKSASEIVLWVMTGVCFLGFLAAQHFHPFVNSEHVLYPAHLLSNPLIVNIVVQMTLASGVLQVPSPRVLLLDSTY